MMCRHGDVVSLRVRSSLAQPNVSIVCDASNVFDD